MMRRIEAGGPSSRVEVSFAKLARACLAENDRRLAPNNTRLIRPRMVPAAIRLALRFTKGPKTK